MRLNNRACAAMIRCKPDPTMSTFVLHILQTRNKIGYTTETEEDTGQGSPHAAATSVNAKTPDATCLFNQRTLWCYRHGIQWPSLLCACKSDSRQVLPSRSGWPAEPHSGIGIAAFAWVQIAAVVAWGLAAWGFVVVLPWEHVVAAQAARHSSRRSSSVVYLERPCPAAAAAGTESADWELGLQSTWD